MEWDELYLNLRKLKKIKWNGKIGELNKGLTRGKVSWTIFLIWMFLRPSTMQTLMLMLNLYIFWAYDRPQSLYWIWACATRVKNITLF